MPEEKFIGYIKYTGGSASEGILSVSETITALEGLSESLKYFIKAENLYFKDKDFEIPVQIKKGSVEIWVVTGLISTAAGIFGKSFLEKSGELTAEKLFNSNSSGIFKKGFSRLNQYITSKKQLNDILNIDDVIKNAPENLLSKNASLVDSERSVEVGYYENEKIRTVSITNKEKYYFYHPEEEDQNEEILPQLKDGQKIILEGKIWKINEGQNTIGFKLGAEFENRVLTCKPVEGNLISFKNMFISTDEESLFTKAEITGYVSRKKEVYNEERAKKPQIIFTQIVPKKQLNELQDTIF